MLDDMYSFDSSTTLSVTFGVLFTEEKLDADTLVVFSFGLNAPPNIEEETVSSPSLVYLIFLVL